MTKIQLRTTQMPWLQSSLEYVELGLFGVRALILTMSSHGESLVNVSVCAVVNMPASNAVSQRDIWVFKTNTHARVCSTMHVEKVASERC